MASQVVTGNALARFRPILYSAAGAVSPDHHQLASRGAEGGPSCGLHAPSWLPSLPGYSSRRRARPTSSTATGSLSTPRPISRAACSATTRSPPSRPPAATAMPDTRPIGRRRITRTPSRTWWGAGTPRRRVTAATPSRRRAAGWPRPRAGASSPTAPTRTSSARAATARAPSTSSSPRTGASGRWPGSRSPSRTTAARGATGVHTPFAEEWATSGHAVIVQPAVNSTNAECKNCHDGKTVLRAWGVVTNYEEKDSTGYSAATCAVCHNPHGSPNTHQLRFPIDTPDPDQNLCMKCHLRRGEPTPGSSTPHGVQGFVVLGTGGYR